MIPRKITSELLLQLNEYPIVTVLGPKTGRENHAGESGPA